VTASILKIEHGHGIVELCIDHLAKKNALNESLISELGRHFESAQKQQWRCLILRGQGGQFCSGYDLSTLPVGKEFAVLPDENLNAMVERLAGLSIATIACVEGSAIGAGCDLAQSCDLVIAQSAAFFQMPPARIGVVYPLSGLSRLAARIGLSRAKRMLITAKKLNADEAHQWGLVDEISETPYESVLRSAKYLATLSPISIAGTKKGIGLLAEHSLVHEYEVWRRKSYASADINEGRKAALEKRAPLFTGK
jgi:enoyl-CoA hydratase